MSRLSGRLKRHISHHKLLHCRPLFSVSQIRVELCVSLHVGTNPACHDVMQKEYIFTAYSSQAPYEPPDLHLTLPILNIFQVFISIHSSFNFYETVSCRTNSCLKLNASLQYYLNFSAKNLASKLAQ